MWSRIWTASEEKPQRGASGVPFMNRTTSCCFTVSPMKAWTGSAPAAEVTAWSVTGYWPLGEGRQVWTAGQGVKGRAASGRLGARDPGHLDLGREPRRHIAIRNLRQGVKPLDVAGLDHDAGDRGVGQGVGEADSLGGPVVGAVQEGEGAGVGQRAFLDLGAAAEAEQALLLLDVRRGGLLRRVQAVGEIAVDEDGHVLLAGGAQARADLPAGVDVE